MYITCIKIKNFRSLVDAEITLGRYTAVVGLNDSGKSNLLRALNLFFNRETDPGQPLLFARDFSQQAKKVAKKVSQIEIQIELTPPANYTDRDVLIWRKIYRSDSTEPYSEDLVQASGEPFSKGSRTAKWAKSLSYEYVPAIRGPAFFAVLKRRLYHTLANTVSPKLTKASATFLSDLRKEVKKIEDDSQRILQLKTEFALPVDLGDFFETLGFDSSDAHTTTALQFRGDGVQGRHIPLILKFLADQRKINSAKGKPAAEAIWGFEEPENNLELIKQIETAEEFDGYSKNIQIIATTHSPAFYGQAKHNGNIRVATRNEGRTLFSTNLNAEQIDSSLGLMTFVEPYLYKAREDRDSLLQKINILSQTSLVFDRPALYVEGETDKIILNAVLEKIGANTHVFDIMSKPGLNGGANWVTGCCVARAAMTTLNHKTAALLDDDEAGRQAQGQITKYSEAINQRGKVKFFTPGKNNGQDAIRLLKTNDIKLPIAIEELCGEAAWDYAEQRKWLEDRSDETLSANTHMFSRQKTFDEMITDRIDDPHTLRIINKKIIETKKGQFARWFSRHIGNNSEVPSSLETLAQDIAVYFGALPPPPPPMRRSQRRVIPVVNRA